MRSNIYPCDDDGLFKVRKYQKTGNKWQIIDWQGNTPAGFQKTYDQVAMVGALHLAVQDTNRKTNWSIRDLTGKEQLILGPETEVKPLNRHLLAYREKGSEVLFRTGDAQ